MALCASLPNAFEYRHLANDNTIEGHFYQTEHNDNLTSKRRKRNLYSSWQMSSYTALSALSLKEIPELPEDKADEGLNDEDDMITSALPLSKVLLEADLLPHGAQFGNVVHQLLENINFSLLAQAADISQRRDATCQRYGLKLTEPRHLDLLLQQVVLTPLSTLDICFCLSHLQADACIKEMPFYLALQPIDVSEINIILADCPAFQPLTPKQMCGYLTGFIDLICLHAGLYYIIDYKTNRLENYQANTLINAMLEHNYGLQYWLYSVVLHQYLKQRLPNYDHAQHFGGIRYLFVRGMQPAIPNSGVYEDLPDLNRLEKLTTLFRKPLKQTA